MSEFTNSINSSAAYIQSGLSAQLDCALVLGSGLNTLAETLIKAASEAVHFNYADIPCLSTPSIPSHNGKLSIININEKQLAICQGRIHLYEGYSAQEVCSMVYLLHKLGCNNLIITNAAGALASRLQPGNCMLISDHLNFTGRNPIIGQDESFGTQFADMSQAYSRDWLQHCLNQRGDTSTGIYAGVLGPSLETNAERRMLHTLGADAVGMSTVSEVIAANHCGMNVLGISAITNLALGDEHQQPDTIEDVLENAAHASKELTELVDIALQWQS